MAGSGHVVGFAQYCVLNRNGSHQALEVQINPANEKATSAEIYPPPHLEGIVRVGDKGDPDFDKIAAQLRKVAAR